VSAVQLGNTPGQPLGHFGNGSYLVIWREHTSAFQLPVSIPSGHR